MTSEERAKKVKELLETAKFPESNGREIMRKILDIETENILGAIDETAGFETPYILFALENIAKVHRAQLAYSPKLQEIYAFLKFTFDSKGIVVTIPKPRSEDDK